MALIKTVEVNLQTGERTEVFATQEEEAAILAAQAETAANAPKEAIKRQIIALEAQQTPRRIRESIAGTDNGWIADLEAQIAVLRAQL